jgi:uncharacterized protein (TIGR03435 family)
MRCVPVIFLFTIAAIVSGQTRPDVSVVKLHPDHLPCGDVRVLPSGQLEAGCFTVELMVREGLNLLPNQISGGPDWVRHDRWDISAKAASLGGKPDEEIYRQLLLGLAAQRFSLKLQSEKRPAKGFALIVAEKGRLGPGLRQNSGEPHSFDVKPGPSLSAHAITMSELATWLRIPAGAERTVVDQTDLAGLYDVDLRWTPLQSNRASDTNAEPVIFPALQQQLGLKLVAAQVDEDVYEIQAAERPASN